MITGVIKTKIDKIWTDIWAGGIANPLTVIEQLTYLMFIRSLDEKELETEEFETMTGEKLEKIFPQSPAGQSMRWSKFKNNDPRQIYDVISQRVFPAIKSMKYGRLPDFNAQGEMIEIEDDPSKADAGNTAFARYMGNAMFLIPTPQLLQKIITGLDDLYEHDISELDMQGDLYEYMLGKLASAGQNGQFRTPKHIREMMVELLRPTPDDVICDPACGTAGFLVSASEYIRRHYEDTMTSEQWEHFAGPAFTGFDTDFTMLRISAMNLMLHSISTPEIDYKDSVSKQNQITEQFTMCLANPPFKGTIDAESIHDNLKAVTNTKKTELLMQMWNNKPVSTLYEPGSTFKIITLSMALEEGITSKDEDFYCSGSIRVMGDSSARKCWKTAGHGDQNLTQALQHSCNVAFITLGTRLGAQKFYEYAEAFGFLNIPQSSEVYPTAKTGIDLGGESGSLWWTKKLFYQKDNLSQLAAASFGQTFTVTPPFSSAAYQR